MPGLRSAFRVAAGPRRSCLPSAHPSSGEDFVMSVISTSGAASGKSRSDSDSQIASCPSKNPMTNPSFSSFSVPRAASQAPGLALQQLYADLQFEIANLSAWRWLGGVQSPLGGIREAALLSDRNEI